MMAEPSIRLIVSVVSATFGISSRDLLSQRRGADVLPARQAAYWLARDLTRLSFQAIGRAMGGRDPTTIIAGVRVAQAMARNSETFRTTMAAAHEAICILAASRFSNSFGECDAVALAQSVLVEPVRAAMSISGDELAAMATRLLGQDDVMRHTMQLLVAIDELVLANPDPLRRIELARLTRTTISQLNQALADLGCVKTMEAADGNAEKSENRGCELAGAAEQG